MMNADLDPREEQALRNQIREAEAKERDEPEREWSEEAHRRMHQEEVEGE